MILTRLALAWIVFMGLLIVVSIAHGWMVGL